MFILGLKEQYRYADYKKGHKVSNAKIILSLIKYFLLLTFLFILITQARLCFPLWQ